MPNRHEYLKDWLAGGFLPSSGEPNVQNLRYMRWVLTIGLAVTTAFDGVYFVQQRPLMLAMTLVLSAGFATCLLLVKSVKRVHLAMHTAIFMSATTILLSFLIDPNVAYWLHVTVFAMLLALGRRGVGWIIYLMAVLILIMVYDSVFGMHMLSASAWMNIMFSLLVLTVISLLYLHFIGAQQQEIVDYSKRLSLEQAKVEKMELARTLAGGVAHLINNDMQVITARSYLLKEKLPPELQPELAQLGEVAYKASSHANQLLTYSGYVLGQMQPVCLNTLLHELRAEWEGDDISSRLQTDIEIPAEELYCKGDTGLLRQALKALLDNAQEACEEDGCIRVSLERSASHSPSGGRAVLTIRDDGEGMNKETLERMFDPFFTTRFTGRGLGLAAASGVARIHQGEILIESEKGKGTVAALHLPLLDVSQDTLPDGVTNI